MVNDPMSVEERDILDRFERGGLRSTPDAEREIEIARQSARHQQDQASQFAGNRARLQPCSLEGRGRRDSLSDTLVQRHPQVPVRPADGEEVGRPDWIACHCAVI